MVITWTSCSTDADRKEYGKIVFAHDPASVWTEKPALNIGRLVTWDGRLQSSSVTVILQG
jgi:hypothetical protein